MRLRKHVTAGAALMASAVLLLSGCGGSNTAAPAQQSDGPASTESTAPTGEINLGVAYETTDYGPITTSALAMGTNWHVLEGLYQFDMADYSVHPALAAGDPVEVSDLVYEVALRDGAKFSDGTDVTADDVVAAYERTTDDKSIYKQFFDFVKSVSVKDATTVTIELNYPFTSLKERFTNVKVVPAAMDADALKAQPVGTGPFKYESITPTEVTAVPNEHYNGEFPAKVERMRWHVLKDDSARLAAALDGTTDIMEAVPATTISELEATGWTVDAVPGYGNPFLMFNTAKEPFNNNKVRQAFHTAIDTQKLIDTAMEGQAVEATSFLPESNPSYSKAATQFTYDKDKAKALLDEAGASGLEINLVTTDHPWVANLVPQIKADLEAIGITVNHTAMASSDLYGNVTDVDNPTYDVVLAPGDPSVFGTDPGIILSWWNADNVWTQKRSQWKNTDPENFEKFQTILAEAVQLDGDAAKAKWAEAQDLLAEQAVVYPLFHRNMITAYNGDKLDGVKPIASTGLELVGVGLK
ncbi:ABC transporter substrate-binding protein [Actinomyces sp. B33]|uniref:ABC transporter substrate-binding protein n=1 Tax=Actinomyces sp. B33 TaxID=2942131 RepID=UPI00233FF4BB|nr:ABC transporter substrate-binding protein [Actinomyces sp. B33]MDC4233569.1 ABC transporter substrate-binding protein [Actinomyces sp. B33]